MSPTPTMPTATEPPLAAGALLAYGGLGLPLAFVALPVYVLLPDWYAQRLGLPLALIGALLLASRLMDALADPWIGLWVDRLRQRLGSHRPALMLGLPLLASGFAALFHPPALGPTGLVLWLLAALLLTYGGYSLTAIAHQAWGAGLAASAAGRVRVTAAREACGLAGVLLAALLPGWLGMTVASGLLAGLLALFGLLLSRGAPADRPGAAAPAPALWAPLARAGFRRLLAVFMLNGIASALPATLVLFFLRDALGLAAWSGPLLALYFLAGAAAMPLWTRLALRIGLAHAWLAGMGLALLAFGWVPALPGLAQPEALAAFALLSVLSGLALGADLVLPAALLAGLIQRDGGLGEGACFGLWQLATKLNLALAAGLALPLLDLLGYVPGGAGGAAAGTGALTLAYGVLPCLLKGAAALLWTSRPRLHGD